MLRYATGKYFLLKNIALCAMFFFLPLCSMESAEPIKKKKKPTLVQRLKQLWHVSPLVNCGLTLHLIPQEVMRLISLNLTLQDMGRLNRVRKNAYWDLEHICDCTQVQCNTVACKRLVECHYDVRTKVMAHYAQTRNGIMFHHLWMQDEDIRCLDLEVYLQFKYRTYSLLIENKMKEYGAHYCTAEKIEKRRLKQLIRALSGNLKAEVLLKKILPNSGFNIFYTAQEYRKKQGRKTNSRYYLRDIFKQACDKGDSDLILMMLGGKIHPRAFKYIFAYAGSALINHLKQKNAFVWGIRDKHGKNIDDYMEDHDCSMERKYRALWANGGIL